MLINLINSLRAKPGYSLSMFPKAILHLSFAWILVNTKSMLLSVVPPAVVLATIGPKVEAVTGFLVLFVLSFVGYTVCVDVDAHTMHIVVVPMAIVLSSVFPLILAYAVDPVVHPVSLIN